MSFIKNISKSEVLTLKEQVSYQKGQVVSKTVAQPTKRQHANES